MTGMGRETHHGVSATGKTCREAELPAVLVKAFETVPRFRAERNPATEFSAHVSHPLASRESNANPEKSESARSHFYPEDSSSLTTALRI